MRKAETVRVDSVLRALRRDLKHARDMQGWAAVDQRDFYCRGLADAIDIVKEVAMQKGPTNEPT